MSTYKTEQEAFWAGEFGDEYIDRNKGAEVVAANLALFAKVLARTRNTDSVIEFGSNRGLNLLALRQLLPRSEISAIEINQKAVHELEKIGGIKIYHKSILDFLPDYQRDFVFIKGVMIHLNPDVLPQVYDLLYQSSAKYICVAEYYNPTPVEVSYRGHKDKLFKRDFAGEILDRFPDLQLVDYGFCYEKEYMFPNNDITWFLMEKR
ncbi:MAG: pseudaminic acid biosynthesis-associated methylase [Desulfuromonadales bacterium]